MKTLKLEIDLDDTILDSENIDQEVVALLQSAIATIKRRGLENFKLSEALSTGIVGRQDLQRQAVEIDLNFVDPVELARMQKRGITRKY
jgi:hypothetical protein